MSQNRFWVFAGAIGLSYLMIGGCGDPASDIQSGAIVSDAATGGSDSDAAAGADAVQASCVGSAIAPAFAARDIDCAYLLTCYTSAQCYCGDKCPADITRRCDPKFCTDNHPVCYCGDKCGSDKKICPDYVCKAHPSADCAPLDDCVFNNAPLPQFCGCSQMPAHKPDCSCGKNCGASDPPTCSDSVCVGKSSDKCIVVPGEPKSGCFCETCGLLGYTPKCFFVHCN